MSAVLLLVLRFLLAMENKRRDDRPVTDDGYSDAYIAYVQEDGKTVERKVDRVCGYAVRSGSLADASLTGLP